MIRARTIALCVALPSAWAQTPSGPSAPSAPSAPYPAQPVRAIVTTAAGGGLDHFSRMVAKELSSRAGQPFFVDNRPGAGTTIGATVVARAKPDGYTLLFNTSAFASTPAIFRKIPYDPLRDFAPITLGASTPNLLVIHPSVPAKSIRDMIALAKTRAKQGDPILYASGGNGTNGHLAVALFVSMAQSPMTHVPYRSGSLGLVDLMAGQVALMIDSLSSVMPQVRSGKLRALGVASARPSAAAPGIPAIAESGLPGYESAQWYGLWAPAGTPVDIIAWLHRETTAVLRAANLRERFAAEGLDVIANTPDEFAAMIKAEIEKWIRVVKAAEIPLM